MSRLENWMVVQADLIVGNVYGDPRFVDGTEIWTSRVVRLDLESGKAYTKNTEYELGRPYDSTNSND